jgi:hypothetical protein
MTISAELQARYTSEVDVDWWEALVLSHPAWSADLYLTGIKESAPRVGLWEGVSRTFTPALGEVVLPKRDPGGDQAMAVEIDAVGAGVLTLLQAAIADRRVPPTAQYTVYIEGETGPQIDPPWTLVISDVAYDEARVLATVSRADLINAPFPRQIFRPEQWPGLDRR